MFIVATVWSGTRALNHPILGPKFGPIPNAKKYVFFPIPEKKNPNLTKKKKKKNFFFFLFSIFISSQNSRI